MFSGESIHVEKVKFFDFKANDLFIRHTFNNGDGIQRIIYESGAIRRMVLYFNGLESSVKRIASNATVPWHFDKRGCWLTSDAKRLWHALRNIHRSPKELCEGRRLGPWLRVGLHVAFKWAPRLQFFTNSNGMLDVRSEYPRRAITHIVNFIRRVCKSKRFRDKVNNDTRNAKENYLSCCTYFLDVLRIHARPLVLRVDLYFEGEAKAWSESEAARKAYDKFIRNLSTSKIVSDVLAYIGKRENGLERRIHFHVLVALDGNKHRQTYNLTEQLGRYWVRNCVGSSVLATYKNCYERKDEYRHNCLGLLHYTNEEMLKGLRHALEYMCEEGAHILVGEGMGRNLRKGLSPKFPTDGKGRGAPRKYGNDTSLAERILFSKPRKG